MAIKRKRSSIVAPESIPPRKENAVDVLKCFSSWSSFLEYLQDPSIVPKSDECSSDDKSAWRKSCTESKSLDDAISISRKGYAKIVPGIMEYVTEIDYLLHK